MWSPSRAGSSSRNGSSVTAVSTVSGSGSLGPSHRPVGERLRPRQLEHTLELESAPGDHAGPSAAPPGHDEPAVLPRVVVAVTGPPGLLPLVGPGERLARDDRVGEAPPSLLVEHGHRAVAVE